MRLIDLTGGALAFALLSTIPNAASAQCPPFCFARPVGSDETWTNGECGKAPSLSDKDAENELRQKHAGQVVFSNTPSPSTEAALKDRFAPGERIYARIVLARPLGTFCMYEQNVHYARYARSAAFRPTLFADGKELQTGEHPTIQGVDDVQKTVFDTGLDITEEERRRPDMVLQFVALQWTQARNLLPPGEHRIRYEVRLTDGAYRSKEIVAVGEFTFVAPDRSEVAGGGTPMPKSAMHDAKLESDMLAIYRANWPKQTPLKAVVEDDAWSIERDGYGHIASHAITGAVAYKRAGGDCVWEHALFRQPALAKSKYGKTSLAGVAGGAPSPISCSAVAPSK